MFTRRRLLFALAVVVLGLLATGAWYLCTKGFTRRWRGLIAGEFEKRGVELTLARLTLDPFRGLVAQNVKLYDAHDHRHLLATLNEVVLGVNYAEALSGGNFLDWVDLRDANLELPFLPRDSADAPLPATRLNARLFLAPHQLYLARGEAEILGIQVYATGRLVNPEEFPGHRNGSAEAAARLTALRNLLSSLHYQETPPVLTLEFSGDLAHPEELAVDARLSASSLRRKSYTISHLAATATCRHGVVELQKFAAADGRGEIHAAGRYDLRAGTLVARVESGLALNDFARAFGLSHHFDGLVLSSPPNLDLNIEGAIDRPREWRVYGRLALERFTWESVAFKSFSADIGWMHGHWSVRDLRLRHASGKVEGDLLRVPGGFRAHLHGALNPRELSPAFIAPLGDWLDRFDFTDAPTFNVEISGLRPAFADCEAQGEIRFGRASFDGQPTPELITQVHYARSVLTLAPFRRQPDQPEESQLIFDLKTRQVRVEKMAAPAPAPAGS